MNKIDLQDKIAIITGGAQGIGYAVAERFIQSGAHVSIWDIDGELAAKSVATLQALAKGQGGKGQVHYTTVDIADETSVQTAYDATTEALGTADILVNSAGIAGANEVLHKYDTAEMKRIIDINLLGTFYVNRVVVPAMIEKNYGRIVNISSVAGKEGNPTASIYSATKAAVIAMTKSMSKELAHKNIAVNCVTPAAADTRIFEQVAPEHIDYMLSKIPRGRFLKVEEAAAMITWMVSAENSFTTGSAFDLSGGRTTY